MKGKTAGSKSACVRRGGCGVAADSRRFFGSDKVDEPTAEWADEGAAQLMLEDVTLLFEMFAAAAQGHNAESQVAWETGARIERALGEGRVQ